MTQTHRTGQSAAGFHAAGSIGRSLTPAGGANAPSDRAGPPDTVAAGERRASMTLNWQQIVGLFVLAIPIACVARTVVFEEVFREVREACQQKSRTCDTLLKRKFFYLFTCE